MTKDAKATIKGLLYTLEGLKNSQDDAIYTCKSYSNLLKTLSISLESCDDISSTDADRVLTMSIHYKMDMQCAPYVLATISSLIKMNKDRTPVVEFLPSALAILDFLNQNGEETKLNYIQAMSFRVLMSHPQEALVKLVKYHCRLLIETFQFFLSTNSTCPLDTKVEALSILQLLRLLPAQERSIFVKEGTSLWLSGVLSTLIQALLTIEDTEKINTHLTDFELLVSDLVEHDYSECPEWHTLQENTADSTKFHMSIQSLLENGKDTWHRIWIVIIKLLKDNVTVCNKNGSPINGMLPVVETAFKLECVQRVRAFACWDQLIRNFSSNINTHTIKRVKLIVIPLKLNNVRTEDSAIAKFNTWWLCIRKLKSQLEFTLIDFIHFLFGKGKFSKSLCVSHIFENLKKTCLEAFVEILGHSDCEESSCCTAIEPLGGKVVNTAMLAKTWDHWLRALKRAVKIVATNYNPETRKNMRCIWKSFLLLITEVADDSAKRVWFNDLIEMLSLIAQNSVIYEDFFVMVIEDLTLPIFKDGRIQTLLNSRPDHRPMHKILTLITDKSFDSYFKRFLPEDIMKMLQPIVSNLLSESITNPEYTVQLLEDLPSTDSSLKLWTAFIRTASNSDLSLQLLSELLRWPFKIVQNLTDVKYAALAWFTAYNAVHAKVDTIEVFNEISELLTKPVEDSRAANYFNLFALIAVLKLHPDEEKIAKLEALTYEMNDYEEFLPLMPPLVEALVLMMDNVASKKYENLAQITINCMNNLLKVLNSKTPSNQCNNILISTNIPYIDKSMHSDTIILAMKAYLKKSSNESIKKEIDNIISSLGQSGSKKPHFVPKEFESPNVQEVKKSRKKEAKIVNTVVENGEEYVVVKSSWKFNPKNLTENQKEKFKRKRDIPALYQDLSQSQDEFKLSTWKTDSQDTSPSSSKSVTNTDASEILKTMPGTDVVPKIMENILDSTKTANQKMCVDLHTSPVSNDKILKVDKVACTPKGTKSPRMAFKDRVFRNVRNLIEKSSPSGHIEIEKDVITLNTVCRSPTRQLSNEKTDKISTLNQIEKASKSPISKPMAIDNQTLFTKSSYANKNAITAVAAQQDNQNIKLPDIPATKTKKDEQITNSAIPLPTEERPAVDTPATNKKDTKGTNSDLSLQTDEEPAVDTSTTKTKKDGKIPNPAHSLQSDERPARTKRKPKKFDGTLLVPLKKRRYSSNGSQTVSQESSAQPDILVAQIHTIKDISYDTNIDQSGITVHKENDVANKANANKQLTITNSVDIVLNDSGNIKSHINEKDILIAPPITDKITEKPPENLPTTVEVASDKDQASHVIKNSVTQIVTEEENIKEKSPTITTIEIKEPTVKRTPVARKRLPTFKLLEKNSTPQNKLRKTRSNTENSGDITSPVSQLLDKTQEQNQEKPPANNKIIGNRTDKIPGVVVPTINQGNKNSQKCAKMHEHDEKSESFSAQPSASKEVVQPHAAAADKDIATNKKLNENEILEKPKNDVEDLAPKSSIKKTTRKSRIESELMIDMVERHAFLKAQSEKRTRKKIMEVEKKSRRKSSADRLNKSKLEATPKSTKTVEESQGKQTSSPGDCIMDEPPCSEDIIESSQDSTITTISVKSTRRTPVREPVVSLERLTNVKQLIETQHLTKDSEMTDLRLHNEETHEKTDIELSQNKTAEVDKNTTDLTENMDTEPIGDINASADLIILDNTESSLIGRIDSEPVIGPETQELAEADTQPNDPEIFIEIEGYETVHQKQLQTTTLSICEHDEEKVMMDNNIIQSLPEPSLVNIDNTDEVSSPFKNDDLRKQDFLNNTLEISPIKIRSPEREKKSPSPETSSDFVVIKLSSPVHSNGEPFEKHDSPEFFTEDKVSPDKRDLSPPRPEVTISNTSPSSSLSLKKNRTPVRSGGRAAQMLDLICVNSDLKITKVSERADPEDIKKATVVPFRRNLRILYNSVGGNSENSSDLNMEEEDNFLMFKRTLPTVATSPSGPILKRKLIDTTDEAIASPASKRKRVSFHDPPVSTFVSVHNYLEPLSLTHSPESSAKKRFERQTRSGIKSPKRLENAFNLDSVLSKTVESFIEAATPNDDTQNNSLDITPIVEIVKSSNLNDSDPIYPDLIDCKDPIGVIATELSSSSMRELFVKELEGKVEKVGDLAKMTELEINRLCIKAPKIEVAKKVLTDYAAGRQTRNLIDTVVEEEFGEPCLALTANFEMQTDEVEVSSKEIQTVSEPMIVACIQTEDVSIAHTSMQTNEPDMTIEDTISLCLAKEDFIEKLSDKLDDESIKTVAERLPTNAIFDLLVKKSTSSTTLQNRLLKHLSKDVPVDKKKSAELSFVRDHLCERYERSDLFTMCIQLLQDIKDKPA